MYVILSTLSKIYLIQVSLLVYEDIYVLQTSTIKSAMTNLQSSMNVSEGYHNGLYLIHCYFRLMLKIGIYQTTFTLGEKKTFIFSR